MKFVTLKTSLSVCVWIIVSYVNDHGTNIKKEKKRFELVMHRVLNVQLSFLIKKNIIRSVGGCNVLSTKTFLVKFCQWHWTLNYAQACNDHRRLFLAFVLLKSFLAKFYMQQWWKLRSVNFYIRCTRTSLFYI